MKASTKTQAVKQAESVLGPEVKRSTNWLSMKETFRKFAAGVKTSQMVF